MVTTRSSSSKTASSRLQPGQWTHTPDRITLAWLLVSLPLVTWDTVFSLGRPHTMEGGYLFNLLYPLYVPYVLYGKTDKVYGLEAWESNDGFTGAQSVVNIIECFGYIAYLFILWKYSRGETLEKRIVGGGWGGLAALLGFAIAVMTLSKTTLYMWNEVCSGFKYVGHNDAVTIVFLYLLPNGFWIVLPTYLIWSFGRNILEGLAIAGGDYESTPARIAAKID